MAAQTLIVGKKHAPEDLGRVLVLGLGKSGQAAVDYLAPLIGTRVRELSVAAGKRTEAGEAFAHAAQEAGARVEFDREQIEGSYDLCIASPGISQFSDFHRSAEQASTEVISEVEFAWRESPADSRWVAVTGTNGKTTTTALAAHLLQAGGVRACAVGNIGDVCLAAVAQDAADVYVAETSSYQLASTRLFAPNVAVILNVTPDHLAWHKSFEAYRDAKLKVLANLGSVPGAVAVLDATDDEVRAVVRGLRAQDEGERGFSYIPVGTAAGLRESMIERCGSQNAAWESDGMLAVTFQGAQHKLVHADELMIKGDHNVANALAAASCALALGVPAEAVREGLRTFAPLEHRIEPCGSVGSVACYNDSKATNVDATLKALGAFAPRQAVVMLGGHDKGTDLAPLVEAARACSRAVVCFGAAGQRFYDAFEPARVAGELPVLLAGQLADALDVALREAAPDGAVLLSPACASFDEFNSFEERGCIFKELVAKRARQASCGL